MGERLEYMSSASSYINSQKIFFLLVLTVILGICLRLYGIDTHYYWYDEIITLNVTHGDLGPIIFGKRPPLFLALAHFWIEHIGHTENFSRILPIIFGVASIPMIYIVGKSLFSPTVGLISAFFMSVSTFQIHYSQELRYYSLFEFLTLVSFYFYIRFLRSRSYIDSALYILSSILLYYSHDFGIFIIAAQNLYILIRIRTFWEFKLKWIISQLLILLAISPKFLSSFLTKAVGERGPNWIPPPKILDPLNTLKTYISPLFYSGNPLAGYIALIVLVIGTIIFINIVGKKKWLRSLKELFSGFKSAWKLRSETILVLLWLIVPIGLVLVLSFALKPMYLQRYLICSAPAFYLLIALGLIKIDKVIPLTVLMLSFVILITPGLYSFKSKPARPNWTSVGDYIKEQDRGSTSIVIMSFLNLPSFNWYNIGNFQYCQLPNQTMTQPLIFQICVLENVDKFWVVVEESHLGRHWMETLRYRNKTYKVVREKEFSDGNYSPVFLYRFEKL